MNDSIFIALVEIRPQTGCDLDPDKVNGAYTRCYVRAASRNQALQRVRAALQADHFEVVEIEWCVDSEATDWENPDDPTSGEMIAQARDIGEVVYGEFHSWGHEAPDATNRQN